MDQTIQTIIVAVIIGVAILITVFRVWQRIWGNRSGGCSCDHCPREAASPQQDKAHK